MYSPFSVRCNVKYFFKLFFLSTLFFLCSGCSSTNDSNDTKDDTLYVKFINSAASEYTITSIQLQAMGQAGETTTPGGTWSDNILKNGKTLIPGAFEFFTLDIPSLHYCIYRLGVDSGDGTEILLYEQDNYQGLEPTITHWGSDERTVEVTVIYDESYDQVLVNGWSDWSGIE